MTGVQTCAFRLNFEAKTASSHNARTCPRDLLQGLVPSCVTNLMTASVNKPANDVIKKEGKISFSQLQLLLDLNRIIASFELNLSKIVRHASLNQNISLSKRNQTRSNTATKPALKTLYKDQVFSNLRLEFTSLTFKCFKLALRSIM